jgi:hypothetical protein
MATLRDRHKVQQMVDIYMSDCWLIFLFLAFVLKHSNIFSKIVWWYLIANKNGQYERLEITGRKQIFLLLLRQNTLQVLCKLLCFVRCFIHKISLFIISMIKLLDADWLREVQLMICTAVQLIIFPKQKMAKRYLNTKFHSYFDYLSTLLTTILVILLNFDYSFRE